MSAGEEEAQAFSLDVLWTHIGTEFAKQGAMVTRGVREDVRRLVRVPQLDHFGGLVKGGVFGITGAEMSGKSLTLLEAAITVFLDGDAVILLDTEGKLQGQAFAMGVPELAKKDPDRFVILQADDDQSAMQAAIRAMVDAPPRTFGLVGIDSLSAMVGRAVLSNGTANSWSLASWMSPTISLFIKGIIQQDACAVITHQVREVKDDDSGQVTSHINGGNGAKHAHSVRTFHTVADEVRLDSGLVIARSVDVEAVKGPMTGLKTRVLIHNPGFATPSGGKHGQAPGALSLPMDGQRRRFVEAARDLATAGSSNGTGGSH